MDNLNKYRGIPYVAGRTDCFRLARMYYWLEHGLFIRNYARPEDFASTVRDLETGRESSVLDLFLPNFQNEGFEPFNGSWKQLIPGDGLMMNVGNATVPNHCGIYVGNNLFLHHLYGKYSEVEALSEFWKSATTQKVRHPKVFAQRPKPVKLDFAEIMNPHVKRRILKAQATLDARKGEVRTDPV